MQDNDLPQIGTPMQTDETRVEVIQADRDALYAHLNPEGLGGCGCDWAEQIKRGEQDDYSLLQTFARHRLAFAAPPAVEREGCPFCGSVEIGWTMLAGHKFAASYCQACNARGPAVPFEMKREPIDETTAPAKAAWTKRYATPDEFRNALRIFIEAHQSPEPYVSYEMGISAPNDRRDEQFAIDVALLDKTYALSSPTLHPSDREAIAPPAVRASPNEVDRQWAAFAGASMWNPLYAKELAESVLRGGRDDTDLVQAFAQHRLAILALSGSLAPEGGVSAPSPGE